MAPQDLFKGIFAPAVVVGVLLLIAWGLASSASRRDTSASAPAAWIAISLGALVGFGLLFGWENHPRESWLWMIWVFAIAAFYGGIEAYPGSTTALGWCLRRTAFVWTAVGVVFLRKPLWPEGGELDRFKALLYFSVPLLVLGLWHRQLPRLGPILGAGVLWMLATGTAAMLLFAGSLKVAQIGGAIAGGLGALIVACWLRPSASGMAGAIAPVAVFLSTLVFLSFEFSYAAYSPWLFVLIALAPLLGSLPIARKPWMRLAMIALPIAIAVALAYRTYDMSAY